MPQISDLPAVSSLSGVETFPVVQSGITRKATLDQIGFTADIAAPAIRTLLGKARERLSIEDFGGRGDGSYDNASAWADAMEYMVSLDKPFCLDFDGTKEYLVGSAVTATPAINITAKKMIRGSGAKILNSSGTHLLKFTVDNTGKSWRGGVIEGLHVVGGVDCFIFEGGNPSDTEWMYEFVLRDLKAEGFTGSGFKGRQGFFESSFYSCAAWANSANVTGYGFEFDNGSYGLISSLDLWGCNTRYGLHGVYTANPVSDVNVYGGTYLMAWQEGIRFVVSAGNKIIGAHVEDNCLSGAGSAGTAGVRPGVRAAGHGTFTGILGLSRDSTKQNYTLQLFAGTSACVVNGGHAGGSSTKFGYFQTDGSSGHIISQGVEFDRPSSQQRIYAIDKHGASLPSLDLKENFVSYAASVTPDLDFGSFVNVGALTGNITINNPTVSAATLRNGAQLEVLLRQDTTGGRTVTWGSQFKVATAIDTTANSRTLWAFRWDGTNWREISAASTPA